MNSLVPQNKEVVVAQSAIDRDSLRQLAKARRANAYTELGPYAGELLKVHFQNDIELPRMAVVAGYWPIGEEMNTKPLLQALHDSGHPVCLPVVTAQTAPLIFRQWQPYMRLQEGQFGIPVPPSSARQLIPDVVLVPTLAFDRTGHRLGTGGGFYDRTLEHLRAEKAILAIGITYSTQQAVEIPALPHDQKLDMVATENGTADFRAVN